MILFYLFFPAHLNNVIIIDDLVILLYFLKFIVLLTNYSSSFNVIIIDLGVTMVSVNFGKKKCHICHTLIESHGYMKGRIAYINIFVSLCQP